MERCLILSKQKKEEKMGGKGVMQLLGTRDRETIEQEKKSEVCLLKTFQLEEEDLVILINMETAQ